MFSLKKEERLSSFRRIKALFKEGDCFLVYPLSVRYLYRKGSGKVSVLIVSPKRYHKLAVERNRIKRLIRESYRLNNKNLKNFAGQNSVDIDLSVTFVSKDMILYKETEAKMNDVFRILCEKIEKCLSE